MIKKPGGRLPRKKKKTQAEMDRTVVDAHKNLKLEEVNEKIKKVLKSVSNKSVTLEYAQDFLKGKLFKEKRYLSIWSGKRLKLMTEEELLILQRAEREKKRNPAFHQAGLEFHQEAIEAYQAALKKLEKK